VRLPLLYFSIVGRWRAPRIRSSPDDRSDNELFRDDDRLEGAAAYLKRTSRRSLSPELRRLPTGRRVGRLGVSQGHRPAG